ncbi:DUF4440 domain-containing protein [Solitalea canadensis]|nr:DUF4440 domain-containing protein [Solitalea canadensis]
MRVAQFKKYLISTSVLLFLATNIFAQSIPDYIEELVNREKQFSKTSAEKGIKDAFLSVLYPDGVVFRPQPVNGVNYFKSIGGIPGVLTWEPVYADVSNDQTLGYTTGPFEYKSDNNGETVVNYGQYVSIWIKPKKKWELMVDLGISHDKPGFAPQFEYNNPMTFGMKRATLDFIAEEQQKHSMEILKATDELYCTALNGGKVENSYKEFLSNQVRLLRNNNWPILGKSTSIEFLNKQQVEFSYKTDKVYSAPSRDLGYTTGTGSTTTTVKGKKVTQNVNYVRIWRKENSGFWRVVLDIEAPIPTDAN